MEDVFNIWYDNKDRIVSNSYAGSSREIYKLTNPRPIYHLEVSENAPSGSRNSSGQHLDAQSSQNNGVHSNVEGDNVTNELSGLNTHSLGLSEDTSASQPFQQPLNGNVDGMLAGGGNGRGIVHNSKHLPGHQEPQQQLLPPLQIEWYYLDAAGNEQGPFNGEMMQDWLSEGYLNPDLRIRRPHQQHFITLKDLCEQLNNFVAPFAVPQPAHVPPPKTESQLPLLFLNSLNPQLSQPLAQQLSQSMLNDFLPQDPFASSFGTNLVDNSRYLSNLQMPTLLLQPLQQHQQHPSMARSGGWGLGSNPATPGSRAPSLATLPLQSLTSQGSQVSPWAAGLGSRVSSPFVATAPLEKPKEQPVQEHTEPAIPAEVPKAEPALSDVNISLDVEPASTPRQEPLAADLLPVETPGKKSEPESTTVHVEQPQPSPAVKRVVKKMETKKPAPTAPAQPVAAPWASNQQKELKPQLTLKEIQALDVERLAKQKQAEAEARSAEAAKVWAAAAHEEKASHERPSLPSTASWGVSTATPQVSKTLAEIQKEEAEAARNKLTKATSSGSTSSFASALANSVPKDEGSWTTVASKKVLAKKPSQATITSTTTASNASPQILRSVSATRAPTTSNNISVQEDFLVWARSAMTNLYPTVSKDDLFSIFLALPANSDSSVLISETIYSSSATMDGRRFAEEFLKRRKKVEQQIGKVSMPEWTAAIASSANKVQTVDEDGWSTSVKSKKKKRAT